MGSTFGKLFQVSTWGESHGEAVGVVIDGCPPGVAISREDVQKELDRRRPGQSKLTTQRREGDRVEILSGVFEGLTTGTPLAILVRNENARPEDYIHLKDVFRPSHADFTYRAKYGIRDWRGGGRASARETIGRVAAGAVARKILAGLVGMEIVAYVRSIHRIVADLDPSRVQARDVESNSVRCPDPLAADRMERKINSARRAGDSVGGVIELVIRNVPPGLGEPVFDRLDADLGKAMLSIPATKGFEVGSGFEGALLTGSENNDAYYLERGKVRTRTNRSGGIQGGISNGEEIFCRIAFKPTATINHPQETVSVEGKKVMLRSRGRHDPCVLPRAVVIVEAMAALVLADHLLRHRGQCGMDLSPPRRRPPRPSRVTGKTSRAGRGKKKKAPPQK